MDRVEDSGGQETPLDLIISENFATAFRRGQINEEEFFFNFTNGLLSGSEETWDQCIETIPQEIDRRSYLRYLRDEIEAHDFEPYPILHVFPHYTDEEVAMVKQDLKPKYIAIVSFVRRRLG